jgi:tetratricopeptide (TPR) repeat protein
VGYTYRRRRSGPKWGVVLSVLLLAGAGAYFAPQYLAPPAGPPRATDAVAAASSPVADPAVARLAEGDSHLAAGRWLAAAAAYAEAARANPDLAPVQARWARALLYSNRAGEALEHAQEAVDLDPRSAENHAVLALAHDWAGNPDRALTAARRAVELDPRLPEAHAYLAEAYTDKYRLREAEEALERAAAAAGGDHPEVLRVQGYLQETKTDYASAVASYTRAVERAPERSYLHLSLGHALRVREDEAPCH